MILVDNSSYNKKTKQIKATAVENYTGKLSATPAATQADSVAATLAAMVVDFNALLAKLKAAGIMSA